MISRKIKVQILVFVALALVGMTYVGARYAELDRLFGERGYTVSLRLADSGGLFTNSEVTYRGVAVGRVGPLRLTDEGIEASLLVDPAAPPIPDDVEAVIANRSAIGEQYVDLRPRRGSGPFLHGGSVIPQTRTRTPLPTADLLADLDSFSASVPRDSLRTVVDELHTALRGAGEDLRVLLDTGHDFTRSAAAHLPATTRLLTDGRVVLETQREQADVLKEWVADARLVAEQLRASDGDVRGLLRTAPQVARQISGVLAENDPDLGVVIANLLTTSQVLVDHRDGVERILVAAPDAVAAGSSAIREDGAHLGLLATFFDPLPCTRGYGGTQTRGGLDTGAGPPWNQQAGCTPSR